MSGVLAHSFERKMRKKEIMKEKSDNGRQRKKRKLIRKEWNGLR
jgi:hypothetical protein